MVTLTQNGQNKQPLRASKSQVGIRPAHYRTLEGIEVWDIIDAFKLDFYSGIALKHILRAGRKVGTTEEVDVRKAITYLAKKLDNIQKGKA